MSQDSERLLLRSGSIKESLSSDEPGERRHFCSRTTQRSPRWIWFVILQIGLVAVYTLLGAVVSSIHVGRQLSARCTFVSMAVDQLAFPVI